MQNTHNPEVEYPLLANDRGAQYWLDWRNLLAARYKFRRDKSNEWRYDFEQGRPQTQSSRTVEFSTLTRNQSATDFSFVILADTGEGDRSQYALVPLIRSLKPDFMIIVGDLAYPAGRREDYIKGFFEPYRNLRIPIWAVPGNHEYYSKNQGREFYDFFCTQEEVQTWAEHHLRLRPQPGTYWELRQPGRKPDPPLAVIGLDTGKKGDLDGSRRQPADDEQLQWLDARLETAEHDKVDVILLFHIPALARGRHCKGVYLQRLHEMIAARASVKVVICGHEHNFQRYQPNVFAKYLKDIQGAEAPQRDVHYLVNGGGGAFLGNPKSEGPYKPQSTYPTYQWWQNRTLGARFFGWERLANFSLAKPLLAKYEETVSDDDAGEMLSFLLVKVRNGVTEIIPVYMNKLPELFPGRTRGINVIDTNLQVNAADLVRCQQMGAKISLP
jgi:3',5'-cyclic AMP phosphodiesterase CpdA